MRKVIVDAKIKLVINVDEGIEISDVIDELDYNFTSNTEGAVIDDTEFRDYEVVDSK